MCFDVDEKPLGTTYSEVIVLVSYYELWKDIATAGNNKKLSYCWETVRRESMPRIAEMDVEMTT